jgi:hypothetical protein
MNTLSGGFTSAQCARIRSLKARKVQDLRPYDLPLVPRSLATTTFPIAEAGLLLKIRGHSIATQDLRCNSDGRRCRADPLLDRGPVLGLWAFSFTSSNVHNQLAQQKITFPALLSSELATPQIGPYLNQYAGKQLLTGPQAEAWADHFIPVHLENIDGGKTYSQLSAEAQADPTNTKLAAQVDTVFRGTTLRGLLLEAYAFWKMGQIALFAAIASFILAGLMLLLTILGFLHLRKVPETQEL